MQKHVYANLKKMWNCTSDPEEIANSGPQITSLSLSPFDSEFSLSFLFRDSFGLSWLVLTVSEIHNIYKLIPFLPYLFNYVWLQHLVYCQLRRVNYISRMEDLYISYPKRMNAKEL